MSHIDATLHSGAMAEGVFGPGSSNSSDSSNSFFVRAKAQPQPHGGAKPDPKCLELGESLSAEVVPADPEAVCGVRSHEPAEIMTLHETSELLRISRPTLLDLVKRNALPCRRVGRAWRFRRSAVLQWLEGNGVVSRSQRGS